MVLERVREKGSVTTKPPLRRTLDSTHGTFLTSISLENVRCFGERQSLALTDDEGIPSRWTIILGENGVGKTTLLQAMAIATSDEHEISRLMFASWDHDGDLREPAGFHRGRNTIARISAVVRHLGEARSVGFDFDGETPFRNEGQSFDPPPLVCGYGASRRLSAGKKRPRLRSRGSYASLFVNAPLRNAEEWLLQEDYAAAKEARPDGPARRRLDRLTELLTSLLPEVSDVRVGESRGYGPGVDFRTPYGWVPLAGLSLGYQSLVAWMVDLASAMFDRYSKHANPLAEPAIVLVDEIDLHLHPKWQRDLMRFLTERFPNTQFIATAHSPLVVQAAADANIVLLRRDNDHVVIENNPENVRNWRVDQILTSDLYGLPTARPPHLDELIAERRGLLTKTKLTAADRKRLASVEAEIGDLPAGESPEQQRALRLILEAAEGLPVARSARKRS